MSAKDFESLQIVFFDGHCNLCNNFVDFVVRIDQRQNLYVASLQGDTAKILLSQEQIVNLQSIVFYDKGRVFDRSTAVLYVLSECLWAFKILKICLIVPKTLRDFVYGLIARNRYRWFGRRETCRLPSEQEKKRFLP